MRCLLCDKETGEEVEPNLYRCSACGLRWNLVPPGEPVGDLSELEALSALTETMLDELEEEIDYIEGVPDGFLVPDSHPVMTAVKESLDGEG